MKIIAFNGSPKGPAGNTDMLIQAFLRGATMANAETETVYLSKQTIQHCNGCFTCWFKTPGICVHQDDMQQLLTKYLSADIVCFATPVYTWNMTAYLKNFVDRLVPLKSPALLQENERYDMKNREEKKASVVTIANAGFPGAYNFDTLKAVFTSANPVLEIYCNCGMALKKDLARVSAYLHAVESAGYQLVADGTVQDTTLSKIQQEMIPAQEYASMLGM